MAFLAAASTALASCGSPAEDIVRQQLIDPDSAQFREIVTCPADHSITRGQVNGKNRMGAYTGFETFFVEGEQVYFAADPQFMAMTDRCYGDGPASDEVEVTADSEPAAEKPDAGAWIVSTDTNPIDDTKTVTAILVASEGESRFDGPVGLVVRCKSNATEMYANWHEYMGDDSRDVYDEWKRVTVRVGDAPAQEQRWDLSTDKQATFTRGSPIPLLKQMLPADRLVLQSTPYNENPITAVFDLTGIREALAPVAETCGWEIG